MPTCDAISISTVSSSLPPSPDYPHNDDDGKKARKSSPAKAPGDYSALLARLVIG